MTAPSSASRAVLLVARREFTTQVRSRSFAIGLVATLALFAVIGLLFAFTAGQTSSSTLGLTSQTAALRPALIQAADGREQTLELRELSDADGRAALDADELDALLTGTADGYTLVGRDTVDAGVLSLVQTAVQQQVLTTALAGAGVDPARLAAQSQVAVDTTQLVDPEGGQRLALALVGTLLLFISVSSHGALVATGVVEEKQSRVVELLLATIRPWQLLSGKVLGLGAVGLLQLVVLSAVSMVAAAVTGVLAVPAAAAGMFAVVVLWYLLGFFLYAALYAAVGSTVSRQEELNSVVTPLIFLLLIPFILVFNLLPGDPRNELATVLSFVPLFSQTVMPARYALGVAPLWEVAVSVLLTLAAIVVVVRVAARVYENSILRTGARIGLREALRGRSA